MECIQHFDLLYKEIAYNAGLIQRGNYEESHIIEHTLQKIKEAEGEIDKAKKLNAPTNISLTLEIKTREKDIKVLSSNFYRLLKVLPSENAEKNMQQQLLSTNAIASETLTRATDVFGTLLEQKEQMLGDARQVEGHGNVLREGNKTLIQIDRTARVHRGMLFVVIFLELLAITLAVIYKLDYRRRKSS